MKYRLMRENILPSYTKDHRIDIITSYLHKGMQGHYLVPFLQSPNSIRVSCGQASGVEWVFIVPTGSLGHANHVRR